MIDYVTENIIHKLSVASKTEEDYRPRKLAKSESDFHVHGRSRSAPPILESNGHTEPAEKVHHPIQERYEDAYRKVCSAFDSYQGHRGKCRSCQKPRRNQSHQS